MTIPLNLPLQPLYFAAFFECHDATTPMWFAHLGHLPFCLLPPTNCSPHSSCGNTTLVLTHVGRHFVIWEHWRGPTPLPKWKCAKHPGLAPWWAGLLCGRQELVLPCDGGCWPKCRQRQQHWCRPGGCVPGQAKASAPRSRLGNWVAPASGEEGTGVLLLGH